MVLLYQNTGFLNSSLCKFSQIKELSYVKHNYAFLPQFAHVKLIELLKICVIRNF